MACAHRASTKRHASTFGSLTAHVWASHGWGCHFVVQQEHRQQLLLLARGRDSARSAVFCMWHNPLHRATPATTSPIKVERASSCPSIVWRLQATTLVPAAHWSGRRRRAQSWAAGRAGAASRAARPCMKDLVCRARVECSQRHHNAIAEHPVARTRVHYFSTPYYIPDNLKLTGAPATESVDMSLQACACRQAPMTEVAASLRTCRRP